MGSCRNRRGEILTLISIGIMVIIGISTVITSLLVNNQKRKTVGTSLAREMEDASSPYQQSDKPPNNNGDVIPAPPVVPETPVPATPIPETPVPATPIPETPVPTISEAAPTVIQPTPIPFPESSTITTLKIPISPIPVIQNSVTTNQTAITNTSQIQRNMEELAKWCLANPVECKEQQQTNDKESLIIAAAVPLAGVAVVAGVPTAITVAANVATATMSYGIVGRVGTGFYYSATGQTNQTAPGLVSFIDDSSIVIGDTGVVIASSVSLLNPEHNTVNNTQSKVFKSLNSSLKVIDKIDQTISTIDTANTCISGRCNAELSPQDNHNSTFESDATKMAKTVLSSTVKMLQIIPTGTNLFPIQSQTEANGIQKTVFPNGSIVNQPLSNSVMSLTGVKKVQTIKVPYK